ncbi:MAG: beta-galactosidase, partial [Actinomycetota bacterium]|nr:beta-galactosidase [Actinomycetota bacterium]
LTRHQYGQGVAHYVTTFRDVATNRRFLRAVCDEAGVDGPIIAAAGVEAVRRRAGAASYLFVINHTDQEVEVPATGHELLTGAQIGGDLVVAAGGVAVVREGRG